MLKNLTFRIPLTGVVLNWIGQPAVFQEKELPIRQVLLIALAQPFEGDQTAGPEARDFRMTMAHRVHTQETLDLTLNDVVCLAPLIMRSWAHPVVYTHFMDLVSASIEASFAPAPEPAVPAVPVPEPSSAPATEQDTPT